MISGFCGCSIRDSSGCYLVGGGACRAASVSLSCLRGTSHLQKNSHEMEPSPGSRSESESKSEKSECLLTIQKSLNLILDVDVNLDVSWTLDLNLSPDLNLGLEL